MKRRISDGEESEDHRSIYNCTHRRLIFRALFVCTGLCVQSVWVDALRLIHPRIHSKVPSLCKSYTVDPFSLYEIKLIRKVPSSSSLSCTSTKLATLIWLQQHFCTTQSYSFSQWLFIMHSFSDRKCSTYERLFFCSTCLFTSIHTKSL